MFASSRDKCDMLDVIKYLFDVSVVVVLNVLKSAVHHL